MIAPIEGPYVWLGKPMEKGEAWLRTVSSAEVDDVLCAFEHMKATGKPRLARTKDDFPLTRAAAMLHDVMEDVKHGRGVALIRGLPTRSLSDDDAQELLWGISLHLGVALVQDEDGGLIGRVEDSGRHVDEVKPRGYNTNRQLRFHTDPVDVVGLLCIRHAMNGGVSRIASSGAIHNEMLRMRPALTELLYQPLHWNWTGVDAPGKKPWYTAPVFGVREGRFACRWVKQHITASEHWIEVPRLSEEQHEALDLMEELTNDEDFHLDMSFQPGDLQLLNNHVVVHGRSAFTDSPEPGKNRKLYRIWLAPPDSQPLVPEWTECYKSVEPGTVRGGVRDDPFLPALAGYRHAVAKSLGMTVPA